MAWTYKSLQDELLNEVDETSSDARTLIKQAINDICSDIWFKENWSFKDALATISSISGTREYDLTTDVSDLGTIIAVTYKGENDSIFRPLNEVDLQGMISRYNDTTVTTRPSRWCFFNNTLYLLYTPDYSGSSNVQIYHDKIFTELSADDDVPGIPARWKYVIKRGCRWRFWNYDDDIRDASEWAVYGRGISDMRASELNRSLTPTGPKLLRV